MARKKCKKCDGFKHVVNPKHYDFNKGNICTCWVIYPKDYYIDCPDCDGTGNRARHKKDDPSI